MITPGSQNLEWRGTPDWEAFDEGTYLELHADVARDVVARTLRMEPDPNPRRDGVA